MKSPCKLYKHVPFLTLLPLYSSLVMSAPVDSAQQDSIAILVGSQSEDLRRTLLLPKQGQSKTSVEDLLGPPEQSKTIGKPAITTWRYKDMTVYFEGNTVLRAVVHHRLQEEQTTAVAQQALQ